MDGAGGAGSGLPAGSGVFVRARSQQDARLLAEEDKLTNRHQRVWRGGGRPTRRDWALFAGTAAAVLVVVGVAG